MTTPGFPSASPSLPVPLRTKVQDPALARECLSAMGMGSAAQVEVG
jgi:hypothetical protein